MDCNSGVYDAMMRIGGIKMLSKQRLNLNWRQGLIRIWIVSTVVWMGWVIASESYAIDYFLRFHLQHEKLAKESQSRADERNTARRVLLAELQQLNEAKRLRDIERLAEYTKLYKLDKDFAILQRLESSIPEADKNEYDALGQNPYDKNRPLNPYEEIGKRLDKEDRERRLARPYTLTSPEPGSLNMDERISRWDVASKRLEELTKIEGRDALRIQEIRMMRPAWANPFSEKVLFAAEQLEKSSKKQGQWQVSWLEASAEDDGKSLDPEYDWIIKLLAPPPIAGIVIWLCILTLGWLGRGLKRADK